MAEEQQREADEQMTQHVLRIMRKAGVLAGVNAPEADDVPIQLETAKVSWCCQFDIHEQALLAYDQI